MYPIVYHNCMHMRMTLLMIAEIMHERDCKQCQEDKLEHPMMHA